MTLAEWIRRQCNATIEGSTIAAIVCDAVCAQPAGAGVGTPPPPNEGFIRQSAGGLPAIRGSVGAKNLENFWVENSVKLGSVAKANQRGELVAAKPETLAYRNWKLNRLKQANKLS